jgi:hypothetical protein
MDEFVIGALSLVVFHSFTRFATRISVGVRPKMKESFFGDGRVQLILEIVQSREITKDSKDLMLISTSPLGSPFLQIQPFELKNAVFTLFSPSDMVIIREEHRKKNFHERE